MNRLSPAQEPLSPILPPTARILVVKLAGIGDLLLATPALRALRETYPQATIDLLVASGSEGILAGSPLVSRILVLNKYAFDSPRQVLQRPLALAQLGSFAKRLHDEHYDTVLLLHHLTLAFGRLKYQALLQATGSKIRAGLDNGQGSFLTHRVADEGFGARHEADYYLEIAGLLGASSSDHTLALPLSEDERQRGTEILDRLDLTEPGPLVAVHPGAGGYSVARRWPAEQFTALLQELYTHYQARLLLVGGPEERSLAAEIARATPVPVTNLAGTMSLKEMAAVIERCRLYIGNDAGPLHVAVAVKTPVVAIFGLSNVAAWGPYTGYPAPSPKHQRLATVVRRDLPCSPCFYVGHSLGTPQGCATRHCLTALPVATVFEAVQQQLALS